MKGGAWSRKDPKLLVGEPGVMSRERCSGTGLRVGGGEFGVLFLLCKV